MARAWYLGLLVFVGLMSGLIFLHGPLLALLVPTLCYWMFALWRAPGQVRLDVRRELSARRVLPGAPVTVKVHVRNVGDAVDELSLLDSLPAGLEIESGSNHHLISIGGGKHFAFSYTVRGPRGGYRFHDLSARAGDGLGLLGKSLHVDLKDDLIIMPRVATVTKVPIRPRRTRVYAGAIPARVGGPGVEFFGVRRYQTGDSARRINWRASAKLAPDYYSNEFQQERVADVAVVLDGRERTNLRAGPSLLFEHSVLAAGSLASALLREGNRVGLLVYSQYLHWTVPGYGKIQRERVLQALARSSPGGSQVFENLQNLPTWLFPPASQIVLVSPLLEEDLSTLIKLRARGYQLLVICPDPVAFELSDSSHLGRLAPEALQLAGRILRLERAVLLAQLRRARIRVIEWDVNQALDDVMRTAFHRDRSARVQP